MKLKPFKKDGAGYGNLDMANQHESDKETPIRQGRQGKDEKGETYIGLPARNGKKMTLNKIQHTKVGDDIHFFVNGVENRGIVVKMGGTYVQVFKEDGNIHDIPINDTFFVKDILVNKTWDDMTDEERVDMLQKVRAYSPRFVQKNWNDLPRELRTVISEKATGMEQNHDKDNLEVEDANHAQTGYAQTQQNTLGKGEDKTYGGYCTSCGEKKPKTERVGAGGSSPSFLAQDDSTSTCPNCKKKGEDVNKILPLLGAGAVGAGVGAAGALAGKKIADDTGVTEKLESVNPLGSKEKVAPAIGAAIGAGLGRAVGGYAGGKIGENVAEHRRDKNPSRGKTRKSISDSLKTILELKSDVESGKYGNAGSTAEVGVSTDTPLDVSEESGYEERPHISLEDVGKLPRSNSKPHHSNEVKESKNIEVLEPKYIKDNKKKGEGGQTGSINTSEGGAFNPVYNAYDTPITPEETATGRKISGRDQLKKGVPLSNVGTWGLKYVSKEEKKEEKSWWEGESCPHCGKKFESYPALSREDNKTNICSDCGTAEAMADHAGDRELR